MKYILTLIAGLVVGGALVFFVFVGTPRASAPPGTPVSAPDPAGDPPGTALVTLDEKFFEPLLGSIFQQVGSPSFPLQLADAQRDIAPASPDGSRTERVSFAVLQGGCQSQIALVLEGSGARTAVRFVDGRIQVPLAFTGSYNAPIFGCINFRGWAQAGVQIIFNQERQTVYGQINVESVNLEGAPAGISQFVTPLVQQSINRQINPVEILRAPQLAVPIPMQQGNGTLNARVREVRAEQSNNTLRLHIIYDFTGTRGGQPPAQTNATPPAPPS